VVTHLHPASSTEISLGDVLLLSNSSEPKVSKEELNYFKKKLEKENVVFLKTATSFSLVIKARIHETDAFINLEKVRQASSEAYELIAKEDFLKLSVFDFQKKDTVLLAFIESFLLSSYSFQKYKSEKKEAKLKTVDIYSNAITKEQWQECVCLSQAVCTAKDWVNEPLITFTAEDFAKYALELGKDKGFKVTVFDKKKIEKLKMGGLLAINAGSLNPPTFIIAEYKPAHPVNPKPIVLIGKGVVYDTGGLSLKPTPNSMDYMKCDMAGGAAVLTTLSAIAETKLPVHVMALVPATENRPDGNAITPGDVITMYNGKTVEIMNTDAEGRIILADALSYAQQFDPELVIDVATLTGNAVMAIGNKGIVYMGTASKKIKEEIEAVSFEVYERLVEFPLWEEYGKYLESDIADFKNLGGSDSGAISAGKFLEKFTSFPWLHLDIAAMAFLHQKDSYRGKGGTGVGVRLLYHFIRKQVIAHS
jgi:leucyl aminopeptidase